MGHGEDICSSFHLYNAIHMLDQYFSKYILSSKKNEIF